MTSKHINDHVLFNCFGASSRTTACKTMLSLCDKIDKNKAIVTLFSDQASIGRSMVTPYSSEYWKAFDCLQAIPQFLVRSQQNQTVAKMNASFQSARSSFHLQQDVRVWSVPSHLNLAYTCTLHGISVFFTLALEVSRSIVTAGKNSQCISTICTNLSLEMFPIYRDSEL